MAAAHASCVWLLLLLGACAAAAAAGAECGQECAACVYRSLGHPASLTSPTCSLECEGGLDSRKLRLCREALLDEESRMVIDEDADQQQEQEAGGVGPDNEKTTSLEHQLAKKYGGFMKRYGGFMLRRSSSSSPQGALEDSGNQEEEENVRLEILKILNAEAEHGGERGGQGAEAVKRYGGFMRRAGGEGQEGDLLEAVLGRGLKKRYGGFMRRVGRPEWLVDDTKNAGGGRMLKRAWEDDNELQKRYGGFMD
ncbi:proenkephalin-A-like [Lampris incognitus]|uniref:proenkephalin-A-like n=1 Tax=Lampris incognitus TaxID=2546036 RepID=UPI0024B63103|nr:proenkephalin-A-like [Lampris incognitus]